MAEIRLDLCDFNYTQIKKLFSIHNNLIATFRGSGKPLGRYRRNIFKTAIKSGARWIDLDMDYNDNSFICNISKYVKESKKSKLILSIHNYNETPSIEKMEAYIKRGKKLGADITKLVFYSNGDNDNKSTMSLYQNHNNIVAFNMGEKGKSTRAMSIELGAPFTYVALKGEKTAPGQMTIDEIKKYPYS